MGIVLALAIASPAVAHEPVPPTPEFQRFEFSFFKDDRSAEDALDIPALAKLEGGERARAEYMLLKFLPDTRAVIGLGALRSRRAELPLQLLFESERTSRGWIDIAQALWRIRPDPRWLAAMTSVLTSSEWTQRSLAAEALFDVCDPGAVTPLIRALDDPQPLVRHHAARALLATHGLPPDPINFKDMTYRVMAADAAQHASAKRYIFAAIRGRPLCTP